MKYEINMKNLFCKSNSLYAISALKDVKRMDKEEILNFIKNLNNRDKLFVKGKNYLDYEVSVESFNIYIEKAWISSTKLEINNLKFHNGKTIDYLLVNSYGIENLIRRKGDVVVNVEAKLGSINVKGGLAHLDTINNDYLVNFIIKNGNEEIKGKMSVDNVFKILNKILK